MDPAVLDQIAPPRHAGQAEGPHRVRAASGDSSESPSILEVLLSRCPTTLCIMRWLMDTKTKLVIAALLLIALGFLVIGGIIAIGSPPDACC